MRSVYIETSVWGMASAGQNPVLRQPTLEFLRHCERRRFLPHISDMVSNEIQQAPADMQDAMLKQIAVVKPLVLTLPPEVDALAQRFLDVGILPKRRLEDAEHVACALFNELDLLVSWNYRQIANVAKAEAFNAVAVLAGYRRGLQIHTPLEVLEWK